MKKVLWTRAARVAIAAVALAGGSSCGELTRQGQGSSYLIVQAIEAASGATPSEFGTVLSSDVITVVDDVPTVFGDSGRVTFTLGLKDAGPSASPSTPSSNNFITVDRYHVTYVRADGRNTPGVDVPYPFDGAFTVTVSGGDVQAGFTLVRTQAKVEAPLLALTRNGLVISTIAEITFYGHDQTGREVSATGRISVHFANFGDPE
jgi:hypothetical protein